MTLSLKRFGCVGVVGEDGVLAGIVTDGDIARRLHKNLVDMKVEDAAKIILSAGMVTPDNQAKLKSLAEAGKQNKPDDAADVPVADMTQGARSASPAGGAEPAVGVPERV